MARVAIIVTCFNDGETLGETVASIRAGAPEVELVIVDDGSSEERTLQVLSQLKVEGVRVIHQENRGPGAAAMAGVETTAAPYVMRFDADDLLEPGAASALADALDAARDAAAAWGDLQTFGLTDFRSPEPSDTRSVADHVHELPSRSWCSHPGGKRCVAAGGWQLRDGFEDWDLWMSLAERGNGGTLRVVV